MTASSARSSGIAITHTVDGRYKALIDRSDEALRTATIVLGAVVANHLFSAADAFVSARLARAPVSAATALRAVPGGLAMEWRIELRP